MKIFALNLCLHFGNRQAEDLALPALNNISALRQALQGPAAQPLYLLHGDQSPRFLSELFALQSDHKLREKNQQVYIQFEEPDACDIVSQGFQDFFKVREAAGGLVVNEHDEVLMIYNRGRWSLPKGHIEPGEAVQDTAYREVKEETGIESLKLRAPLPTTWHTFQNKKGRWILKKTYWYRMTARAHQALKPQAEEQIESVEWIARKKWETIVSQSYSQTASMLKAYWLSKSQNYI